jgi:hypothetical protein
VGLLPDDTLTQDFQALSDEFGHFSLSLVPPGDHTIQGSALGFSTDAKRITVQVGQVTETQLTLEREAVQTAHSFTKIIRDELSAEMYRATPTCMYFTSSIPVTGQSTVDSQRTRAKTCGGMGGCDSCQPHFAQETYKNSSWSTLMAELTWKAQTAVTGKGFLMDVNAPNITRGSGGSIDQANPYTWVKMAGKSPISIRIDNPDTLIERKIGEGDYYSWPANARNEGVGCTAPSGGAPNCDWFVRLFGAYCDLSSNLGDCYASPVDFGLPQNSPFTLYVSFFWLGQADKGFTAIPDQ